MIHKIEPSKPKIQKRLKVAAYCRVSVEKGRTMHSLSAQVSYYNTLIQKNPDWEFAGVYSDGGISGTSTDARPDFLRMIEDAKAGKIDIILTKSISRFARNTVDLLETVRQLRALNVEVRFEKENIHSLSGDGELMLSILASFAQEESRSISENVKWATRKRFAQGKHNGRFHIFGYRWEGEQLVVVPEQAKIVQLIYENYLKGISAEKTEVQLAEMGVKGIFGGRLGSEVIRSMLKNITYTGNFLFQKQYVADPITKFKKYNKGELPQYFVEDSHEAIIPMAQWQAVQDERERRKKLGARANSSIHTTCFTSRIKCAKCGKNYRRSGKKQPNGRTNYVWICRTKSEKGCHQCDAKMIPEQKLQEICSEVLNLETFDEQAVDEKIEQILSIDGETIIFKFIDGTQLEKKWVSTAKKDYWTPERRRVWGERNKRKESAIWNGRFNEFTGLVVCGRCGANYRVQSTKRKDGSINKRWHCSTPTKNCNEGKNRQSVNDEMLKALTAEVLKISIFDETTMDKHIKRISIIDFKVTFHFKDGHQEVRIFEKPKKVMPKRTKAQNEHMSQMMKKRWEERKRGKKNNDHSSNNHEV